MSIDTFKKAGIYLRYCRFAVVPEIPYAQDVLYALRLSEEEKCYTFCVCNHATYVVNPWIWCFQARTSSTCGPSR